jgi:hypothetical protein
MNKLHSYSYFKGYNSLISQSNFSLIFTNSYSTGNFANPFEAKPSPRLIPILKYMQIFKEIQPIAYVNDIGTYSNPFPFEFYFQDTGAIYCIINLLTGQYHDYYIGRSSIGNLPNRLKAHISPLPNTPEYKLHGNKDTTKAIWQFGRNNFAIILLERVSPNISDKGFQALETSYIQTLYPGYNDIKYKYNPDLEGYRSAPIPVLICRPDGTEYRNFPSLAYAAKSLSSNGKPYTDKLIGSALRNLEKPYIYDRSPQWLKLDLTAVLFYGL